MVKLKNLKRNDHIGECDIFPEDSLRAGHIVIDLDREELQEYSLPDGYEWCVNHVHHAAKGLADLLREGKMPEEYLMMWV